MESKSVIQANELFGESLELFTKDYDVKLDEIRKDYEDFFKREEVKDKVFDSHNLYGAFSVDILLDGNGAAKPVDINFFPAGARNYDYEALFLLAKELSAYKGRGLVMLVENAGSISTNPEYYKSLFVYHLASKLAGVELNFRTLGQSRIQKYKEDELSADVADKNKEEISFRKLQQEPFIPQILDKLKIDEFLPKDYPTESTTIIPNTDGSRYADGVDPQFVIKVLEGYEVLNAFPASGWQSRGKHLGLNLYNQILKQELKHIDPVAYQNHKLIVNKDPFDIEVNGSGRVIVKSELTKNISSVIIKELKSRIKKNKDIDLDGDQIVTIFLKTNSAAHGKVPSFGQGILPISFKISGDVFQDIKHGMEGKNPWNISILNEDEEEQKTFVNSEYISNEYYKKAAECIDKIVTAKIDKEKNRNLHIGKDKLAKANTCILHTKAGYTNKMFNVIFGNGKTEVIAMAGINGKKEFVWNIFNNKVISTFERKDNSGNQGKNSLSYQGEPTNKNNPNQAFAFVSRDMKEKLNISIAAKILPKAIEKEVGIFSKISPQGLITQDENRLQMSKPTSQKVVNIKPLEQKVVNIKPLEQKVVNIKPLEKIIKPLSKS
jgi:hypothetical protein